MKAGGSLWSQSGAFWAGSALIAEGLLLLLLWVFVEPGSETGDYLFARPWLIVLILAASVL